MKTALVIGATGLVGLQTVTCLLENEHYSRVVVFSRRPTGLNSPRLTEHLIDFADTSAWAHLVQGDVLFSAMGTTRAQAGGKKQQFEVDYTFQYRFAQIAKQNGVPVIVLVSAAGADPESRLFYTRIKGELERDLKLLEFPSAIIFKPGPLEGQREKNRPAENLMVAIINGLNRISLFRKYRPISGHQMAKAMIAAAKNPTKGVSVFELEEIFLLAER